MRLVKEMYVEGKRGRLKRRWSDVIESDTKGVGGSRGPQIVERCEEVKEEVEEEHIIIN